LIKGIGKQTLASSYTFQSAKIFHCCVDYKVWSSTLRHQRKRCLWWNLQTYKSECI